MIVVMLINQSSPGFSMLGLNIGDREAAHIRILQDRSQIIGAARAKTNHAQVDAIVCRASAIGKSLRGICSAETDCGCYRNRKFQELATGGREP
jgi:hypothetical protein